MKRNTKVGLLCGLLFISSHWVCPIVSGIGSPGFSWIKTVVVVVVGYNCSRDNGVISVRCVCLVDANFLSVK